MNSLPLLASATQQLELLGHALLLRFVQLNFWTAVLLGGALLVDRKLAQHMRASLRIALYAPLAVRVLLPLDWGASLVSTPAADAWLAPLLTLDGPLTAAQTPRQSFSWYALFCLGYVGVTAVLATRMLLARSRLHHALQQAQPLPNDPSDYYVMQHAELGPCVAGLLDPRIVVPSKLLESGNAHTLDCVLRHEAAHIRRHDTWLAAGMQLLLVVAWPMLPLWFAVARVHTLMELACDEAALANASPLERRRYGNVLLDLAEWRPRNVVAIEAGALHFGSTLRARIQALVSQQHWSLTAQRSVLALGLLLLFGACGGPAATSAQKSVAAAEKDPAGYGYEFDTDTAKAGSVAEAPPASALPLAERGRLPPEAIERTVRAHFDELGACYAAGLKKDPQLTGIVTVKFLFENDGITTRASDEKSTLPDPEVVGCVVEAFRSFTYPKSQGGGVTVVYPIQFTP